MDNETQETAGSKESSALDSRRVVAGLSVVWFVTGCLVFFSFGIVAFMLNPFATDNLFEPESYRGAVMVWHLPMVWGWVPAAYRSVRRRKKPWRNARRTILLGICLGPFLFLLIMLIWRWYALAAVSI